MTTSEQMPYRIESMALCELIEKKRRETKQQPIEREVITTRCGIAFTIVRKRWLNFKLPILEVDEEDIDCIAQIVQDRFNVIISKELAKLCEDNDKPLQSVKQESKPARRSGLLSKIKSLLNI